MKTNNLLEMIKGLIDEEIGESIEEKIETLNESVNVTEKTMICGSKEVNFGSPEHINDLNRTLEGLHLLKGHFRRGSSSRYVVASTCHRLKKLIEKLSVS